MLKVPRTKRLPMTFTYTYRSSDGQRHSAEIEAESRDAAFEVIRRERGVKPIKVIAAEGAGDTRNGRSRTKGPRSMALLAAAGLALIAAGLGGVWWWAARRSDAPYQVMTPQGPVTYTVAAPLPRQTIPGDRARIDVARETAFQSPAEAWLARFAEPGRVVENGFNRVERAEHVEGREDSGNPARPTRSARPDFPTYEDFVACLKESVRVASTDFTEVVDLKRIVAGMKREMSAYLAGGGTVEQYLAELAKRQRLEISYRENAEKRLGQMIEASTPSTRNSQHLNPPTSRQLNPQLSTAYSYWLKANASLKSMGIYELPLPEALHGYQAGLEFDN